MSTTIDLTKGYVAIVDECDAATVLEYRWHVINRRGSIYARTGNHAHTMHHLVLGVPESTRIDHANGNGLDNRRANLRLASASENMRNRPSSGRRVDHGFKGVTKYRHCWRARIVDPTGRRISLGYFGSQEEAAAAYDAAAIEMHGSFARLNFPAAVRFWSTSTREITVCHGDKRGIQ